MLVKHLIKTKISSTLFNALDLPADSSLEDLKWTVEIPKQKGHGDYATNIAFSLAKILKKAPPLIATELANVLNNDAETNVLGTFSTAGGFINIDIHPDFAWEATQKSLVKQFPQSNKKTLVEFVSANPTGPLHIGHGRWAVVGSNMVNILAYVGKEVETEFYINDAGVQIKNLIASVEAVKQGKPVPEDGYHGEYIQELAKTGKDPVQHHINEHKQVLESIHVSFNTWFSETSLHKSGEVEQTLSFLKKQKLAYENEGALWFETTKWGDDKDRVLVKKDGNYTYFAVDIAYHKDKLNREFNQLINILGADHHGYVQRMTAAVKAMNPDVDIDMKIGQLVHLFRNGEPVKMSKRSGNIVTLEEVVNDIGSDAVRYFLSEKSLDSHMDFDLEDAKKKNSENPVYYIQYAHARMCSIFKKHGSNDYLTYTFNKNEGLTPTEKEVLLFCMQCHDVLWEISENLETHRLNTYVLQLARQFHTFYEKCPILKSEEHIKLKRLFILKHIQNTLKTCLNILGISAPESM